MSVEAQPVPDLHSVVITAICKVAGWDVTAPMKSGVWLPHDMFNVADEVIEALDIPGIRREAQVEILQRLSDRAFEDKMLISTSILAVDSEQPFALIGEDIAAYLDEELSVLDPEPRDRFREHYDNRQTKTLSDGLRYMESVAALDAATPTGGGL